MSNNLENVTLIARCAIYTVSSDEVNASLGHAEYHNKLRPKKTINLPVTAFAISEVFCSLLPRNYKC